MHFKTRQNSIKERKLLLKVNIRRGEKCGKCCIKLMKLKNIKKIFLHYYINGIVQQSVELGW